MLSACHVDTSYSLGLACHVTEYAWYHTYHRYLLWFCISWCMCEFLCLDIVDSGAV